MLLGLGVALSGLWEGEACVLSTKSRVQYTHAPGLPRFILLVSFSDTLLVVSILDIVYECHLWLLL